MRYLIIILFLISTSSLAQELIIENDSLILWQKSRKLTWDDFKGAKQQPKDVYSMHKIATTAIYFKKRYTQTQGKPPKLTISCYFEKYRSWTITDDHKTLEHEQIHFDIAELYIRKVRQVFTNLQKKRVLTIKTYMNKVNALITACGEYQNTYDDEVLLSYKKQLEWQSKIAKELEKLKEYEYIP
ncbi:hypothetical protein [Aquimarina sp. 2201CG5-10]|uniref:hypothetical protein n=1 Tax=Aquimarina callyspongiae TaxID=3098150 RepID=UPI002AB35231|nr:hypothetical protein [Aquimarina sp. 2201CG5-10]MDY8137910.1 hypothetical protein [Aquimarina sp. 2201CG5-10]